MNKNKKELQKKVWEGEGGQKDKTFKTENTFYRNIVCRVY